jgi:hypothetical protein
MGAGGIAGRDIKLAAIDVLSVFAGFVLGAGAMSRYARTHPQAALGGLSHASALMVLGAVWGLAVTGAAHYLGLRLVREPLAGPSSAALLTVLPLALAAGAVAALMVYRALGNSMAGAAAAIALAAVGALVTPGLTRRLVRDFCRRPLGPPAGEPGAGPQELRLEDGRQDRTVREPAQPVAVLLNGRHFEAARPTHRKPIADLHGRPGLEAPTA